MFRTMHLLGFFAALASCTHPAVAEAQAASPVETDKYAFLLFYKQNDAATQAMAGTLKEALSARADEASLRFVQAGDPANQSLVEQYDVARAPMPLAVAVAPNGAITGVFARKVTAAKVADCFVTPTMMFTMKSLQEGKLVLVGVHGSADSTPSPAIADLKMDPEFRGRVVSTSMRASDPQEARFAQQMKLDPRATTTSTVVIAPPGVLVGKFPASATKEEIASALAKAGKCCDDPNCERRQ